MSFTEFIQTSKDANHEPPKDNNPDISGNNADNIANNNDGFVEKTTYPVDDEGKSAWVLQMRETLDSTNKWSNSRPSIKMNKGRCHEESC